MAYIDIDIEEYLDEVDTDSLVAEIKHRAERQNKTLRSLLHDRSLSGSIREDVCDLLGLNHLASNDDIVSELLIQLR